MKVDRLDSDRFARVIAYHQASKHHLDHYAPGPGGLDWANQPDPFRRFAGAPQLELPLRADSLPAAFESVRRGERPAPYPLERDSLAILFELSLGLSAWKQHGGSRWALRCNPSSGNLHPTEGYLICPTLPGLAAGVHHYLSHDHVLEQRAAPDSTSWGSDLHGGAVVALTGIHWRETWKYGLRAYRYCQHDCGHAIAAISYAAAALGWRARLLDGWGDDALAGLLGLNRVDDFADAELEHPEVALWLGPEPPPANLSPATLAAGLHFAGRANRLSHSQREWRGIAEVDQAAHRPNARPSPPFQPTACPPPIESGCAARAADLIRQRRSAVAFDGVTSLPAERWFGMLDALLPRPAVPPLDAWPWPPRVHPLLFVHRIDGITPGLYLLLRNREKWPELQAALHGEWEWSRVEPAPAHLPLYRLTTGDAREAAQTVSCHQDIAADCCFALGFLTEFAGPLQGNPWVYRELFWETGLLGQILYLEAEAAGIRATGIGCFFDDALHRLLGLEGLGWQSLYHFTVGGPIEDRRLQTLPPYAHLNRLRASPD
ncbi:MAG: SagB/ThcOx family dehydrogenase [Candidatus Competibacteraceae bacterium]|nr:SagB/ThcOx family dehydrogenase [Candidatus Competibacteraceae bacterium]MBK7983976.1 SagB/ThcOx family dehydrogenase [Candidatus Competibacteraceae bacterium]MBK9950525.1 SagB/ThcOx family dehydrogenase [Candidatus Competibacteraceae bacterium]